jgi:hypothetical protein
MKAMSERLMQLSDLLLSVDSPAGRERVARYLQTLPFPHFRAAPGQRGLLERIEGDGTRTVGRFVNRVFVPAPPNQD